MSLKLMQQAIQHLQSLGSHVTGTQLFVAMALTSVYSMLSKVKNGSRSR